ncbi:MAG TPA: DJ-1/PfpI family protein [Thermomicrobiales bacterium]|nr:DJ-1/PfpI family protein [Thermomicrobiales bacterium]
MAEPTDQPQTVGILIFDDVEVLDACGPFEVFAMASRRDPATENRAPLFRVLVVAERRDPVRCTGGLLIQPHHAIADCPPLDLLVVPGGLGTRRERSNPALLDWIAARSRAAALTTSVCTGAFLLAAAGLLDGRAATTHWASIERLRRAHPAIDVRADVRYVDEGPIVTAVGVAAGIDMALSVVARLHGPEVAAWTARQMEYEWAMDD